LKREYHGLNPIWSVSQCRFSRPPDRASEIPGAGGDEEYYQRDIGLHDGGGMDAESAANGLVANIEFR